MSGKYRYAYKKLRQNKNLTQMQLAEILNVSDKAVSKWETGNGLPDISILLEIADFFETDIQTLLSGNLNENERECGNMKKLKFYICPDCGNIITSTADTIITCCGKKLSPSEMKKADTEKLSAEYQDGEWYITTDHPMTKEHYISFVAYLNDSTVMIFRQYPEWQINLHIPCASTGRLVWYCNRCGLMYQNLIR